MSAQLIKKIQTHKIIIFFSFFLASGFWLLASQVSAQDKIGLTAIPPRLGESFELRAAPGEVIQATVRIRNSSTEQMPIGTVFEDFILGEDGSTPIPLNEETSSRWSMSDWVTISPANQIIPAGKSAVVNVVVNIPQDALAGGHYGMALHSPQSDIQAETSQSSINQRVGTLIYLMVEGNINEEAFIRDFNFPKFTEYGPVPYSFLVENVSDIHIHPQIGIEIYNIFGQKIDNINVENKNVFPFTPRSFEGTWDRVWGLGRYNARVVMSYGQDSKVVIAQTFFWLLPIKIVISILLTILALIGILVAIRRHLLHRQDYRQQKIDMLERKIQELEQVDQPQPEQPIK